MVFRRIGIIVFTVLGLFITGCALCPRSPGYSKMDVMLRRHMAASRTEIIAFSGECASPIDDALKAALTGTGITVETHSGSLFTARGTAPQIEQLVRLEVVKKLQGARPVKALKP